MKEIRVNVGCDQLQLIRFGEEDYGTFIDEGAVWIATEPGERFDPANGCSLCVATGSLVEVERDLTELADSVMRLLEKIREERLAQDVCPGVEACAVDWEELEISARAAGDFHMAIRCQERAKRIRESSDTSSQYITWRGHIRENGSHID